MNKMKSISHCLREKRNHQKKMRNLEIRQVRRLNLLLYHFSHLKGSPTAN